MQPIDYQDLTERGYACRAPRCVYLADCLVSGQPFCLGHAELLIEWLCSSPAYRRVAEHPFESVFSTGYSLGRADRPSPP